MAPPFEPHIGRGFSSKATPVPIFDQIGCWYSGAVHSPSTVSSTCESPLDGPPSGGFLIGGDLERPNVQHERDSGVRRGIVLATALTVLGTFYFLKNYVLLHESRDPLVKQGGLKPSQEIKR